MATRDELVAALRERYAAQPVETERGRILDEFVGGNGLSSQARDAAAAERSGSE